MRQIITDYISENSSEIEIIERPTNPNDYKLFSIKDEITVKPNRKNHQIYNLSTKYNIGLKALSNRFNKAFGCTVADYVKRHCMLQGMEQIRKYNHKRIFDIAVELGYADESSFSRAFNKEFQTSPGEYRKRLSLLKSMAGME